MKLEVVDDVAEQATAGFNNSNRAGDYAVSLIKDYGLVMVLDADQNVVARWTNGVAVPLW